MADVRVKVPIACLSNTNVLDVERFRRDFRLSEPFDHCFFSNEIGHREPMRIATGTSRKSSALERTRRRPLHRNQRASRGTQEAGICVWDSGWQPRIISAMHLLFDLDGTLTDSRTGIVRCFQHALRALGREMPTDEALAEYIGATLPIADCFAELLGTSDTARVERAVASYRERFESIGIFENTLYPGTEDALASLSAAGHTLHVVTAKPAVYARRIVQKFRIDGYFGSITGPELDERHVSKSMLLQRALLHHSVPAAEAVVIGDRAADMQGAMDNGMRCVAVTWGYGRAGELGDADCVVDSWTALVACLRRGTSQSLSVSVESSNSGRPRPVKPSRS
jgi:phosphoglycolate phosphatase